MKMDKLTDTLENGFHEIQRKLVGGISLQNRFCPARVKLVSGVDLAYWSEGAGDHAVCSIVTLRRDTGEVVEIGHSHGEITVPYVPGYLSFRELPLILKTYGSLEAKPDVVMFDGNGYLHYRNMGIATHASFYLDRPTIGVAKSYLKINGVDYTMPDDDAGAFTDIVVDGEVLGRALRVHKGVKPVFVSCGNWVDLDTATKMTLEMTDNESRLPIPVRKADIETRRRRSELLTELQRVGFP